jgi:hypothetical protein
VEIKNFTDSWKDGLAFNALIHRYRPSLLNYEELYKNKNKLNGSKFAETNLEHAFSVGQNDLQIERLLDVEGNFYVFFLMVSFCNCFYGNI